MRGFSHVLRRLRRMSRPLRPLHRSLRLRHFRHALLQAQRAGLFFLPPGNAVLHGRYVLPYSLFYASFTFYAYFAYFSLIRFLRLFTYITFLCAFYALFCVASSRLCAAVISRRCASLLFSVTRLYILHMQRYNTRGKSHGKRSVIECCY